METNLFDGYEIRGRVPVPARRALRPGADKTGKVYGRLTVEKMLGMSDATNRAWGCVCECGTRLIVNARCLAKGQVRSCGCINSDACGGRNKLPFGHASRNELLASYKKSAASRGHTWALADPDFFALVSSPCHYCGTPPDSFRKPNKQVNGGFWYSGVDRKDNGRGYEPGNVVSCCWTCNRAKGKLTYAKFTSWIEKLTAFRTDKGAA